MLKLTAFLSILLAVSVSASAYAYMAWECSDIGGGLSAYDFHINNDDGLLAGNTVTLTFSGNIVQQSGSSINSELFARIYNVLANDTYAADAFAYHPTQGTSPLFGDTFTGFRQGSDWWEMSCQSYSPQQSDIVHVAHVVMQTATYLTWDGSFTRSGQTFQASPQLSDLPRVVGRSPLTISPGESITLDAYGFFGSFEQFKWDLDYSIPGHSRDYETVPATTKGCELSYSYLQSLGLTAGHTYDIQVTAYQPGFGWLGDVRTLTITPEPATMSLLGLGAAALFRAPRRRP